MPRRDETRDRKKPIRVFVTAKERKDLGERAKAAGMAMSAYLRNAGRGAAIRGVLDLKAISILAEVNRDQARLADLLRQSGAGGMEVKQIIRQIGIVQGRLAEAAAKVKT